MTEQQEDCTCEAPMSGASYSADCPQHGRHTGIDNGWLEFNTWEPQTHDSDDDLKKLLQHPSLPKVGEIWAHTKTGKHYGIVAIALVEETKDLVVIYERDGLTWSRPAEQWEQDAWIEGNIVRPRFERIHP